ncbi:MAG: T9SS type A sorting domain-containing protein [Bacteroidetes bacterium]|jgi:hypothetical protein|nr:T9SS type A sorting domain-containing protein [Bacteroidota bacterium]
MRTPGTWIRLVVMLILGASTAFGEAFAQTTPLPTTTPEGALPTPAPIYAPQKTQQDEETLSYYGEAEFVDELSLDQPAYVVRISPSLTGPITSIAFPLYDGPLRDGGEAAGIQGSGTLLIELFTASAPDALPALAESGLAQREVPFDSLLADDGLPPDPFNVVDLQEDGFDVTADQDYFVRLMVVDASEDAALSFLSDAGAATEDDPAYFPFRTSLYVRGDALREGEEEGYFVYEDNANLVLDVTIEGNPSTAVQPGGEPLPDRFVLKQNYPNPFNPTTSIPFDVPQTMDVTLSVYNMLGEEVARLVDRRLPAGSYDVTWNAEQMASGIYLARLRAGSAIQTRRMVLVK